MDAYKALPEPVRVGLIGAGLGAGAAMVMTESASLAEFAMKQGLLAAASGYIAPMVVDDKMQQSLAAAGIGAAAGYGLSDYVPGGAVTSGVISGGALHICRMMSS
jgi:hypothetical protein